MEAHASSLRITAAGIEFRGYVVLPELLGNTRIDFENEHFAMLTSDGEWIYNMGIELPDVEFSLKGMSFKAVDSEISLSNVTSVTTATLTGEFNLNLPKYIKNIKVTLSEAEGNYFSIDAERNVELVGVIDVGNVTIVPKVWIRHARIALDTVEDDYRLEGDVSLPLGTGVEIHGLVEIESGHLEAVGLEASDLNRPIYASPPVFLQTIGGEVTGLHTPPLTISPHVVLTLGPEVGGKSLLWLDLLGSLSVSGRVEGTAAVKIGDEDDPLASGSMGIAWEPSSGFFLDGTLNVGDPADPFFVIAGQAALDNSNGFQGAMTGTVRIPEDAPLIGRIVGGEHLSVDVYTQAYEDGNLSNDYLIGACSIDFPIIGTVQHGIEMNLNTGEINWNANLARMKEVQRDGLAEDAAGVFADGASTPEPFPVADGVDWVIFRAVWQNGDTDLVLRTPSGQVVDPANVGGLADVEYIKNDGIHEAYYVVSTPAEGTWQLHVTEEVGLGGLALEHYQHTEAPAITVLAPQTDQAGGLVNVSWVDADSDSDAVISLFYDTDRGGADGTLIASGISEDDGADAFVWDTGDVPAGEYYVYAVIDDGGNQPGISYGSGRVTVVDAGAPAVVTGLNAPSGAATSVHLIWDACPDGDFDHYLIRYTDNAAGEGYGHVVSTGDSPELVLDGLIAGESYRIAVAAVDGEGNVASAGEPIVATVGGEATIPPAPGEWEVYANAGEIYQATVPGSPGDTYDLISAPAEATLTEGLFEWHVPGHGDGWYEVLIHGTSADGSLDVYRYHLLVDADAPVLSSGGIETAAVDDGCIEVVAPNGLDRSGVLRYRLERDGAIVEDWQTSPVFLDTGLNSNTSYTYRVQAEDSSPGGQESGWSAAAPGVTQAVVPQAPAFGNATPTTVELQNVIAPENPAGTEYAVWNTTLAGYIAADGTLASIPNWQTFDAWAGTTVVGLVPDTDYRFEAAARNGEGVETAFGASTTVRTLRETTAPTVADAICLAEVITYSLSEPVALSMKDVSAEDGDGLPISLSGATLEYEPGDTTAIIDLRGVLPAGDYTIRLDGTAVQDHDGNLLDGDGDGVAGGDFLLPITAGINTPPIADIGGPYDVDPGVDVVLDASGSFDPDGTIVLYEWDLDGDGQFGDTFNYQRAVFGSPSTLALFSPTVNSGTGQVSLNGVDTQGPSTPFTWDWGDGTPTEDRWFPASHTYSDTSQNYIVTVTAHYNDGTSDTTETLIRFVAPSVDPQVLPTDVSVTIPDHEIVLSNHRMPSYHPPASVTYFDETTFGVTPRSTLEYVLAAAASVQTQLVGGNVYRADGVFDQVLLQDSNLSGAAMYTMWYTDPVSFAAASGAAQGAIPYSSLFHEMGHNVTLNFPEGYYYGGKIDGWANAIYSETMAQVFQHVTAYELVNRADDFGLGSDLAAEIGQSALASMWVVRDAYESYIASGRYFNSWNDPGTPQDETFDTFMTIAYKFFEHAENMGVGYAFPAARMMEVLALFDESLRQQYDQYHDTPAADAVRATLLTTAISHAFSTDLRQEFRDLNFPIDDAVYQQLLTAVGNPVLQEPTSSQVVFNWPDEGTYPIAVRVTDDGGAWDTDTIVVSVANVAPTVVAIFPEPDSTVTSQSVNIDIQFSETVHGVDATDLILSGAAASAATVAGSVDLGGGLWRFPIVGLVDGSLGVNLAPDAGDIMDLAGNDLPGSAWTYSVAPLTDCGDAPAPFPTLSVEDGARHYPQGPTLGSLRDAEEDGLPNQYALGDDGAGNDDEDGLANFNLPGRGFLGASIEVDVTVVPPATQAYLNAWIDFDGDGIWQADERIGRVDELVADGLNTIYFDVPTDAVAGDTFLRMRLTSQQNGGGQAVTGLAEDGEVEDHLVTIDTPTYSDIVGRASSSGDWFVAKSDGTSFANEH